MRVVLGKAVPGAVAPGGIKPAGCMGNGRARNFLPPSLKSQLSPVNASCATLMFYSVGHWLIVFRSVDSGDLT